MKINNFDVLKRMADDNLKVQLCTMITDMNYSAKNGGTKVTVGVPGNVCFDIRDGKMNAMLLLVDVAQFTKLKAEMEAESAPRASGPEDGEPHD